MKRIVPLLFVLSFGLLFTGCGNDDEETGNLGEIYLKDFPVMNTHEPDMVVLKTQAEYEDYFEDIEFSGELPRIDFNAHDLLFAHGSWTASSSMGYTLTETEINKYTLNIVANYHKDGIYPAVMMTWRCAILMDKQLGNGFFTVKLDKVAGSLPKGYTVIRNY